MIEGSMIFKSGGLDNVLGIGNIINQIAGTLANNIKLSIAIIANNVICIQWLWLYQWYFNSENHGNSLFTLLSSVCI